MKEEKLIPLGSVVVLEGEIKTYMIIGRGVLLNEKGDIQYYQYCACDYPEGLSGNATVFFNHEDIEEIVWSGYEDEDNTECLEKIKLAEQKVNNIYSM